MGDISAISGSRSAALRNLVRTERNQAEKTGLDQAERDRISQGRQSRAIQEQEAARARRLEQDISDRRIANAERRSSDLDTLAVERDIRDRRDFARTRDSDDARLEAETQDADAARPRIQPRVPVTNLSEDRFPQEPPPPAPPGEPSNQQLTPDQILAAREAPQAPFEPLADLGPLDPFAAPQEAEVPPSVDLELQERDRNLRVAERREEARAQDIAQRAGLERANEQINQTTQANPNLPPGSIVNVLG